MLSSCCAVVPTIHSCFIFQKASLQGDTPVAGYGLSYVMVYSGLPLQMVFNRHSEAFGVIA